MATLNNSLNVITETATSIMMRVGVKIQLHSYNKSDKSTRYWLSMNTLELSS